MQRSVLHSKSFQRYFLTYAAIFAAMIFISILLLARTTNMERARAAEQQRSLQAEKISTQLDDMWKSAGSVGELLNNSSWVEKYKSDTDVFDADFDLVSRQEISQTLQNVCLSSTVVQDIGVIYPRKDTVITPQGWFDLQEYQTFLQRNHLVETEDFLDDVLGMTGGRGGFCRNHAGYAGLCQSARHSGFPARHRRHLSGQVGHCAAAAADFGRAGLRRAHCQRGGGHPYAAYPCRA